ncbi:MAG: hypothetical protein ABIL05_05625 [candidate division WOR-3 bacterium]
MAQTTEKKTHLDNLQDILTCLAWWINFDTILTELPYDLEYLVETDMEKFVNYCSQVCSKDELEEGRYPINRPVVEHFVKVTFPNLDNENKNKKVDDILREIHEIMQVPMDGLITMSNETIDAILDDIQKKSGEERLSKVKKRIKVAVALQWLQNPDLFNRLSKSTQEYIKKVGDYYGRFKRGEKVDSRTIGNYWVPEADVKILEEDYTTKLSMAIYVAANDVEKAKKTLEADASEYKQLGIIIDAVKRLKDYVEGKREKGYDAVERFKDTVFISIIINYLQDPNIKKTEAISKLVQWIVPLYNQYKMIEKSKK